MDFLYSRNAKMARRNRYPIIGHLFPRAIVLKIALLNSNCPWVYDSSGGGYSGGICWIRVNGAYAVGSPRSVLFRVNSYTDTSNQWTYALCVSYSGMGSTITQAGTLVTLNLRK